MGILVITIRGTRVVLEGLSFRRNSIIRIRLSNNNSNRIISNSSSERSWMRLRLVVMVLGVLPKMQEGIIQVISLLS